MKNQQRIYIYRMKKLNPMIQGIYWRAKNLTGCVGLKGRKIMGQRVKR